MFAAMAFGIAANTALISTMALIGEWWMLALTFAALVATAIGIVTMIAQRLEETGDPEAAPAATPSRAATGAPVARARARGAASIQPLAAH